MSVPRDPAVGGDDELEFLEPGQLVLSDLVNRVLDKGVVISAHVTLSVADIDLVHLDLKLLISSVATLVARSEAERERTGGDVPVRTDPAR